MISERILIVVGDSMAIVLLMNFHRMLFVSSKLNNANVNTTKIFAIDFM